MAVDYQVVAADVSRTLVGLRIVGPATWAALGGDGPEPPTLRRGSDATVVEKLQTR